MLLNAVMIGIIHAIFSPCKLSAIDDRIRNFTQQHYIFQVVYALSKFSQAIGLLLKDERSFQLCYKYAHLFLLEHKVYFLEFFNWKVLSIGVLLYSQSCIERSPSEYGVP